MTVFALAIFAGGVLLVLAVLMIAVIRSLLGARRGRSPREYEARLFQEIHHGLKRIEQRVDTLENILIERSQESRSKERS